MPMIESLERRMDHLLSDTFLYGWTDQTDAEVRALTAQDRPDYRDDVQSYLMQRIESRDIDKSGLLLSVYLFHRFGRDIFSLCEFVQKYLYDRIYSRDLAVLDRHLFGNLIPLPADLVYDITERILLDIDSMYSSIVRRFEMVPIRNAQHVVLFLSLHNCRVDLNSQNKEMICLIISHIDNVEIPDSILSHVNGYLDRTFYQRMNRRATPETANAPLIRFAEKNVEQESPAAVLVTGDTREPAEESDADTESGIRVETTRLDAPAEITTPAGRDPIYARGQGERRVESETDVGPARLDSLEMKDLLIPDPRPALRADPEPESGAVPVSDVPSEILEAASPRVVDAPPIEKAGPEVRVDRPVLRSVPEKPILDLRGMISNNERYDGSRADVGDEASDSPPETGETEQLPVPRVRYSGAKDADEEGIKLLAVGRRRRGETDNVESETGAETETADEETSDVGAAFTAIPGTIRAGSGAVFRDVFRLIRPYWYYVVIGVSVIGLAVALFVLFPERKAPTDTSAEVSTTTEVGATDIELVTTRSESVPRIEAEESNTGAKESSSAIAPMYGDVMSLAPLSGDERFADDERGLYWTIAEDETVFSIFLYIMDAIGYTSEVTSDDPVWDEFLVYISGLNDPRDDWDLVFPGNRVYVATTTSTGGSGE
jgi:hypothetical protein